LIFTASEYLQMISTLGNAEGFAGNDFSRIVRAEDPVAFQRSATLRVFVGVGVGVGVGDAAAVAVGVGTGT
jgi:hypothetical protein